jgi:hypothetical protein
MKKFYFFLVIHPRQLYDNTSLNTPKKIIYFLLIIYSLILKNAFINGVIFVSQFSSPDSCFDIEMVFTIPVVLAFLKTMRSLKDALHSIVCLASIVFPLNFTRYTRGLIRFCTSLRMSSKDVDDFGFGLKHLFFNTLHRYHINSDPIRYIIRLKIIVNNKFR